MTEALYQGAPLFKGVPIKLVREHVAAERARLHPGKSDSDRPDTEPWAEPVDNLATVLDELVAELGRYIASPPANLETAALWAAMTHVFDRLRCMPKLALQSPTKQCGKTTFLDCLSNVVRRPELTSGVTEASFIRTSDAWQPTWLMDEADRYLNPKTAGEALTAAINASSYRRLARKKICVPNAAGGWDMHDFEFWCPMIMAGIRTLVDTVQDRSIVLVMQRAKPGELKHRLVEGTSPVFEEIGRKLARWAKDLPELDLDPEVPAFLHNREADLWRPLFAIAALAGGDWPERTEMAARLIHGQRAEDEVRLVLLLEAIREEFDGSERMFTADLVARLIAREGEPWATIKRNGSRSTPTTCAARSGA
jgi:putative DNA primase/helicase